MRYSRYCLRHVPFCFGRREVRDRTVASQMAHYCLISQANGLTRWANPRSSRLVLRLKRPSRLPATSPVHLNHAPHSPKPCLPTPDIPRRRLDTTHSRSTPRTNGESWITVPLAWGWRREWDSNPRYGFPYTRFPSERLQPLGHPSGSWKRAQYSGRVMSYNPRKQDPATGTNRRPRMKSALIREWNFRPALPLFRSPTEATQEEVMGRGLLLWLLGIPLPIILLIWVLGGLHG